MQGVQGSGVQGMQDTEVKVVQGSGVQRVQRMQGSRCRAQGCRDSRVQTVLKGTDNTGDAGNRGVLGAGLRGSRIPESECREVRECRVQGCRECRGAEGTGVQGSGMLEV